MLHVHTFRKCSFEYGGSVKSMVRSSWRGDTDFYWVTKPVLCCLDRIPSNITFGNGTCIPNLATLLWVAESALHCLCSISGSITFYVINLHITPSYSGYDHCPGGTCSFELIWI